MKKLLILGILIILFIISFFYVLYENPYRTEKIKVLDCESTYRNYYFNNWSLRDMVIKPQSTTEFEMQFAKKEVGRCLYEKYFETLNPKYKTELLKLFMYSKEVKISEQNFEIDEKTKKESGLLKPKMSIDFNQYYLE